VLGTRFGRIDEWAAPVSASKMDGEACLGAVRTCQFTGFGPFNPGIVKEQLTEFDPETMHLTYVAIGGQRQVATRLQSAGVGGLNGNPAALAVIGRLIWLALTAPRRNWRNDTARSSTDSGTTNEGMSTNGNGSCPCTVKVLSRNASAVRSQAEKCLCLIGRKQGRNP
jgi:hypothetical protein